MITHTFISGPGYLDANGSLFTCSLLFGFSTMPSMFFFFVVSERFFAVSAFFLHVILFDARRMNVISSKYPTWKWTHREWRVPLQCQTTEEWIWVQTFHWLVCVYAPIYTLSWRYWLRKQRKNAAHLHHNCSSKELN